MRHREGRSLRAGAQRLGRVERRAERSCGVGAVAGSAGAVWEVHGAKMAAERQDALREFVAVTGAEEDRARFFLESAGWDLQVAPRGGPQPAGWGMRSAKSALSSLRVRSAQSSLRARALVQASWSLGSLATRRRPGLGVGGRGRAPACSARPRPPRGLAVSARLGALRQSAWRSRLGAWLPRGVPAGGRVGSRDRLPDGAPLRTRWSSSAASATVWCWREEPCLVVGPRPPLA